MAFRTIINKGNVKTIPTQQELTCSIERQIMAERNEQTLVNFKIDAIVKESAEATLSSMGLSTSAYLGMCLRKLAQDRSLPFDLKLDPEFWIDEAQVGRAAELLRSGTFEKIATFRNRLLTHITECFANECAPLARELITSNALIKDELSSPDKDIARVLRSRVMGFNADIRACDITSLLHFFSDLTWAEIASEDSASDPDIKKLASELAAFFEAQYAYLTDSLLEFCTHEDIAGALRSESATHGSVLVLGAEIDAVMNTVIDEYEEHTSSFSLRFVGAEAYITTLETILADRERAEKDADSCGHRAQMREYLECERTALDRALTDMHCTR